MNALYTRATVGVALAAAFIGSLFLPPQQPIPPAQIEKTTVVSTANTEVLDELPTKSQQDGQQHLTGVDQQSNRGPAYGGDTSGTQGKGKGQRSSQDQPEQSQQSSRQNDRDNNVSKDEESRRMSDEEVEKLVEQVVEAERKRWDRKLSEANDHAKDWEQKYNEAKQDLTKNLTPRTATVAEDEFTQGPVTAFWNDPSNLFWVGLETFLFLGTLLWASMRTTKEKALMRQMEEKIRAHREIETETVGSLEVIKNMFGQLEERFPSANDKRAMQDFRNQVDDIVVNLNSAITAEANETVDADVIVDEKPVFDEEGVVMNEAGADASSPVVIQQTPSKNKKKKHHK
eukprot:TRINITY_DN2066_c0_g1_i1.p1 TRINITY_DN2066_c0_g1~~TRINITY_DN2066_c0_g1_i1.p1  ORF type:complete len:344 (-),score=109.65 TRINITY_DN2066_c0_g1_i1:133-1164(-)